jgi:glycosyltransferase involved in cell wall biosynthesis
VERLLVDMAPLVDPDRYRVEVAYVLPWKDAYHRDLEALGVPVHCLRGGHPADLRWVARLRRLVHRGSFDVIHTHAPVPAIAGRLLAGPAALVHTEHNVWSRYRWPTRTSNAVTFPRNRSVIAVSSSVAGSMSSPLLRRRPPIEVIHHGTVLSSVRTVEPAARRARRVALGLPADGTVLGTVGNFTPKKDHRNILRALARLDAGPAGSAPHLVLIGSGPLEEELRRVVADEGLSGRVSFLGTRSDVFELLPLFDAFVLGSRFEGFPIALVEAMATGLPCVATAVGGIPEIVQDGSNGRLVLPGDPEALADALRQVLDDPAAASRLGAAARASAQRLDLRHAVARTLDLYDAAVAAGRSWTGSTSGGAARAR